MRTDAGDLGFATLNYKRHAPTRITKAGQTSPAQKKRHPNQGGVEHVSANRQAASASAQPVQIVANSRERFDCAKEALAALRRAAARGFRELLFGDSQHDFWNADLRDGSSHC
jgi:hypothetical protein